MVPVSDSWWCWSDSGTYMHKGDAESSCVCIYTPHGTSQPERRCLIQVKHGSDSTVGVWLQSPQLPSLGCSVIAIKNRLKKQKTVLLSIKYRMLRPREICMNNLSMALHTCNHNTGKMGGHRSLGNLSQSWFHRARSQPGT